MANIINATANTWLGFTNRVSFSNNMNRILICQTLLLPLSLSLSSYARFFNPKQLLYVISLKFLFLPGTKFSNQLHQPTISVPAVPGLWNHNPNNTMYRSNLMLWYFILQTKIKKEKKKFLFFIFDFEIYICWNRKTVDVIDIFIVI